MDAERFNASSANSMLKFIEEPEQNIIGFLVTNNKENVIATIKSRCEIVRAYYETDQIEANDVDIELVKEFIAKTELDNQKGIVFNKKILDLKLSREQLSTIFKILLNYYLNLFAGNSIYTDFDELLSSLTKKDILRRIELLNDVIDRLNYNVNINLLLDYYLLSLED